MVDIPDSLRSLFTATVEETNGRYVIEVPKSEIEHDAVETTGTYKVALLGKQTASSDTSTQQSPSTQSTDRHDPVGTDTSSHGNDRYEGPPVEEGEQREVTIESLGDKGDGIAKVERGYVLIVPGARPGDEVAVEIEEVRENVAFAEPVTDETPM